MPDTPNVSPLLDGLTFGNPMSVRPGVRCYPAVREDSEKRFIIKELLFPPSQVQLDALLLTKACRNAGEALEYFRSQAQNVVDECEILNKMAALEGFLPYDGCQMIPAEKGGLGYQVYLKSPYRRSLESYTRKNAITHLAAVNLGLDLSGALAACRRAGYLYIDLKPENIFLSGNGKEFRIGDLGFASLENMQFASMPQRYYSPYTAPEVAEQLDALSSTMDVYALGMILYQIYNGGILPDKGQPLQPPQYADASMAEILLKAVAQDPKERYQEPAELGKALAAYLQKETVNDVPIAPLPAPKRKKRVPKKPESGGEEKKVPPAAEPETDSHISEESAQEVTLEEILVGIPEEPAPDTVEPSVEKFEEALPEENEPEAEISPEESRQADAESEEESTEQTPELTTEAPEPEIPAETTPQNPMEPPAPAEKPPEDNFEAELQAVNDLLAGMEKPVPAAEVPPESPPPEKKPKGHGFRKFLITVLVLAILGGAAWFGYRFYRGSYLVPVNSISVTGSRDTMTVTVDTTADPQLMTVVATDAYGNSQSAKLSDGQAVFTGLTPDTLYKIHLEVSGFHKLDGQISVIYTTQSQTEIVDFSAVTGEEEGSVQLSLTVHGYEPEMWLLTCTAEGEETITQEFSGHAAQITGLTVGKTYTVTLSTKEDILLSGKTSLEIPVLAVLTAQDLRIASVTGGVLTAQWSAPQEGSVSSWTVRCYCDGFDETVTTGELSAQFQVGEAKGPFTVEVTAEGMTKMTRITLSSNPISVTAWSIDDSQDDSLAISWQYEGETPENGWLLLYTMDDASTPNVIKCQEPEAVIPNKLPGTVYHITLQSPDSPSIFGGTTEYTSPPAEGFLGFGISIYKITSQLLPTPDDLEWRKETLTGDEFTDSFAPGQSISILLHVDARFYLDHEEQEILYILRDENGKVYENQYTTAKADWYDIWFDGDYRYGELNGPKAPTAPGSYQLDIYFNRMLVNTHSFTVTG